MRVLGPGPAEIVPGREGDRPHLGFRLLREGRPDVLQGYAVNGKERTDTPRQGSADIGRAFGTESPRQREDAAGQAQHAGSGHPGGEAASK
jgi:hypothetical protein